MNEKIRLQAWVWFGIKLFVSLGLLWFLIRQAAGTPMVQELWRQPKRWEWLCPALVLITTGYTISFLRWWLLAAGAQLRLTWISAIRLGYMSLPFHLISIGVAGGDLLRIYFICHDHPEQKTRAAASVVLDRLVGLLTMFWAVALVGFVLDWNLLSQTDRTRAVALQSVWYLAILFAGGGSVAGLAGLIWGNARLISRLIALIPGQRLRQASISLNELVPLYRQRPSILAGAFLLSVGNVLCLSACMFCIARSLTPETPTLSQHFLIAPLSLIAGAAPLPGGLGSQELLMSWLYSVFSVPDKNTDYGFLVAIGYRMLSLGLTAVGLLIYLQSGTRVRQPQSKVGTMRQ